MKVKEIQDIINFIKKTDLDDVSIETENYKIRVKKNNTVVSEIKKNKGTSTQVPEPIKTEIEKVIKTEEKESSKNLNN